MIPKAIQRSSILAIIIGSGLEWYEIFLYIYWAPVLKNIFFDFAGEYVDIVSILVVFAFGFLSRPLGGLIFGYIGDRWGRKKSIILSIVLASIPSIIIGLIPSFLTWQTFSGLILILMRLLQGIPAGGELPGAMCYLEEISQPHNRKYIGSYAFVGAQLGGVLSMMTCLFFSLFFSEKFVTTIGWRLSFIIGGLIGLFGFYLRNKLQESPYFEHLEKHHQISRAPILDAFRKHKKHLAIAFLISISEVVGFFTIAIFPVIYFNKIFGTSTLINASLSAAFLMLSAFTVPLFGKLGDKYHYKTLFLISFIGILLLSLPFYLAVQNQSFIWTIVCELFFIFFLNFQLALLPSLLTDLFPTSVRFTCLGFSFNVCDGLIGGMAPFLAIYLVTQTHNAASFVYILFISTIISLITLAFIKEKKNLPDTTYKNN